MHVRTKEICLFVMREYIKIILKNTKISVYLVRFSYKMNNRSKFNEHGYYSGISHVSPAISMYLLRHEQMSIAFQLKNLLTKAMMYLV